MFISFGSEIKNMGYYANRFFLLNTFMNTISQPLLSECFFSMQNKRKRKSGTHDNSCIMSYTHIKCANKMMPDVYKNVIYDSEFIHCYISKYKLRCVNGA